MPVLSPHHTSPSYRTAFNTSALDRTSYYPSSRITSYSERYSTRSYIDSDGRRTLSRSGSITEDGITSRFKEEIRDGAVVRRDSTSRDSGISSIRENSVLDYSTRRERESSLTRDGSRLSSMGVIDDLADLRSKYSPSNYVPAIHRKNDNISRSKSINDIGLPPIEKTKKKVTTEGVNANASVPPIANTNDNCSNNDDNGNRASVADLRRRFDKAQPDNKPAAKPPVSIEAADVKLSDNKFKILDQTNSGKLNGAARAVKRSGVTAKKPQSKNEDATENHVRIIKIPGVHKDADEQIKTGSKVNKTNGVEKKKTQIANNAEKRNAVCGPDKKPKSKLQKDDSCNVKIISESLTNGAVESSREDEKDSNRLDGVSDQSVEDESADNLGVSRTNNFASYISSKDLEGGDKHPTVINVVFEGENDVETASVDKSLLKDLATSPKSNKNRVSPSSSATSNNVGTSGALNSNSLGRKSVERERRNAPFDDDIFDRSAGLGYRLNSSSPTTIGSTATAAKTLGLNGLKNIGNTCFMNSVIQCLSNTKLLLEFLRHDSYIKDINMTNSSMKGSLIKAFAEVIKEIWSEDSCDRVVNTASLKGQIQRFAPRFMGYAQQDAQEFLRYLLEGLHEDVNRVTEKPKPIHAEIDDKLNDVEKSAEAWSRYLRMDNSRIVDIFVGQLKSTLKCTFCGHCSVTFDPFWDLSLPIPTRTGQLRLSQCLESFTREETLDGDEKPTCSKCKERRKCTKSFSIQKFPKILVIHLKRFSPTERFRGKLNVTVDFPLEALDMSKYAAEDVTASRYNLYAVSNHSGTTYSGHYTAYCRHPYAMTWHEYNDSRVSSASPRSIVSSEAYVLFYEQEGQRSHL